MSWSNLNKISGIHYGMTKYDSKYSSITIQDRLIETKWSVIYFSIAAN